MSKPQLTKEFWLAALRTEGDAFRAALGGEPRSTLPCPPVPAGASRPRLAPHALPSGSTPSSPAATDRPRRPAPTRRCPPASTPWSPGPTPSPSCSPPSTPSTPSCPPRTGRRRRRRPPSGTVGWPTRPRAPLGRPDGRRPGEPIEPRLASDGVTEVLDSWLPAGRRSGPADRAGMIALHATDVDQVWYVRLRGAGVALLDTDTLLDSDDHHERATASGQPATWCWRCSAGSPSTPCWSAATPASSKASAPAEAPPLGPRPASGRSRPAGARPWDPERPAGGGDRPAHWQTSTATQPATFTGTTAPAEALHAQYGGRLGVEGDRLVHR